MDLATLLHKIIQIFKSLRLTISLIVALGVIFLLGLWIPQKGVVDYQGYLQWKANSPNLVAFIESIGFLEIYKSPLALFLWICFFINLSLVMWQRIPVVQRRISLPDPLPDPRFTSFPHRVTISLPALPAMDDIARVLKGEHFHVHGSAQLFYGVRNRLSPVASLLFHVSFFLILLGGAISVYTRFVGQVDLAEGETFLGEPSRYNASPLVPSFGGYPRIRLRVSKITPLIQESTPTGLQVLLEDEQLRKYDISINRPYRSGAISLVLKDLGLAPLVVMRDASGKDLDGAFVKLDVIRGKEDGFRMGPYEFRVRFFPDHELVNGEDFSKSEEFRNPVFVIRARKGDVISMHRISCVPGASLSLDGITYEFKQFSFWVRLTVVSEHGVPLVYIGFLIACSGLLWRLGFYRREIAGMLTVADDGDCKLELAFRSEFYRALAEEEFEQLQRRLEQFDTDKER